MTVYYMTNLFAILRDSPGCLIITGIHKCINYFFHVLTLRCKPFSFDVS